MPVQGNCVRCGYISSQDVCKACVMLEGLNSGRPKLGIGKTHKLRKLAAKSEVQTDPPPDGTNTSVSTPVNDTHSDRIDGSENKTEAKILNSDKNNESDIPLNERGPVEKIRTAVNAIDF